MSHACTRREHVALEVYVILLVDVVKFSSSGDHNGFEARNYSEITIPAVFIRWVLFHIYPQLLMFREIKETAAFRWLAYIRATLPLLKR